VWYDVKRDAFRMINSWGREWGDKGGAWMRPSLLAALLRADGECACPTEVKVK
jgi:hypothetical protein